MLFSQSTASLLLLVFVSCVPLLDGLDLQCGINTIETLFLPNSSGDRRPGHGGHGHHDQDPDKCALCEILRSKLDITHCQSNFMSGPCIANPHLGSHRLLPSSFVNSKNQSRPDPKESQPQTPQSQQQEGEQLESIRWDKTIITTSGNAQQPIFHVHVKRRGPTGGSDDDESDETEDDEDPPSSSSSGPDEFLYLQFNTYPKILPRVCSQRRHPILSPFGHLCPPNAKCVEKSFIETSDGFECECKDECAKTWLLRKILEWVQIVCIVICAILCLVVYWLRKTKVMSVAMWPIMESILFGSILLYLSVILKIEIPTNTAMLCLIEPWTREIGFTLCYGGIILKIYRSLVEFRTRKAHRWVVREKDILRYLGTMTCVILFYMVSWSVTNNYYSEGDGFEFYDHLYCPVTWWHRITELGEVLFLFVGLNMAWHLRRAPVSPFKNFYAASLLIETTTNVLGIIIRESRFILRDDEDEAFLMLLYFIRCQLTTTVILFLVIAPKLYYIREEKRKRQLRRGDTTSSGICAGRKALEAAINNGDLDFADVNIADMDPQDIRLELKRVYTQLELLRNKTMRKDNPHISKRRGGRKPTHRRFSLQKKGSRDKALRRQQQQQRYEQQHQTQRSVRGYGHDDIEDSVCSIEGPSTYSEAGR